MKYKDFRKLAIRAGAPIWFIFSCIVPKRVDYIAVNSFPDFDDTVRSIFNVTSISGLKLIILTIDKNIAPPNWLPALDVKIAYRYSLQGIWLYHRAKYVFFSHGLFSFWDTTHRQIIVNLWHGMPIKNIGLLDGKHVCNIPRFNYTIAYNSKFRTIIGNAFGVPHEKILISGHPRIDGMVEAIEIEKLGLGSYKFVAVWLPTYRASTVGDVRIDGDVSHDIFNIENDLSPIDDLFRHHNCICIVKPHPMAHANRDFFLRYSNIIFVDDRQIYELGITLYQLLGLSDFLITDVSSVYFDYKYTNRPTVIYCPDFFSYKMSRGFVAPIADLIDEDVISSQEVFTAKLEQLFASGVFNKTQLSLHVTKQLLSMLGVVSLDDGNTP